MTDSATETRVLAATRRYLAERGGGEPSINLDDAVCQDLMIFGVDVEDYVEELEKDFGPVVWSIPWGHYTDQTGSYRGCGACLIAPFLIPWMAFKTAFFGAKSLNQPHPREHPHRLTLREVAAAVDAGGWQGGPMS